MLEVDTGTQTDPGRDCPICPRLAAYRRDNRAAEPAWHNAPVDSWVSAAGERDESGLGFQLVDLGEALPAQRQVFREGFIGRVAERDAADMAGEQDGRRIAGRVDPGVARILHRIDDGLGGGGNGRERVGLQGTAIAEVEIVVHR